MPQLKLLCTVLLLTVSCQILASQTFPKIMTMPIANTNYQDSAYQQQIAKFDIAILNFYPGWTGVTSAGTSVAMFDVVLALKGLNPKMLLGEFSTLNEALDIANLTTDNKTVLNANNWWLLNAAGDRVQWTTAFNDYDVNFTKWSTPLKVSDGIGAVGDRYPQWLAKYLYGVYFQFNSGIDILYFNNVWEAPDAPILPKTTPANWKNTKGKNLSNQLNTDPVIASAYRSGQAAEWATAHKLAPYVLQMGDINPKNNLSYPEYNGKLGAAFMDNTMGYGDSIATTKGWVGMMNHYYNIFNRLKAPKIVGFDAAGDPADYQSFRFAYASCLLNNGYFSYTDISSTASASNLPLFFDEYSVSLGVAIDPPPVINKAGVYRRHFKNGMVLLNSSTTTAKVKVAGGYYHILGKQDPVANDGSAVKGELSLPAKSGIVLINYKPES